MSQRNTFINTLGVWEINDDGSVRLISEAENPTKKRSDRYASTKKRNRTK